MKILLIVNESPWGSVLGVTAMRLAQSLLDRGAEISAVYFRGEGVYHAQGGRTTDAGTPALTQAWLDLAREHGIELLLCSSASQRRFEAVPDGGFREAGLPEILALSSGCDRLVSL